MNQLAILPNLPNTFSRLEIFAQALYLNIGNIKNIDFDTRAVS